MAIKRTKTSSLQIAVYIFAKHYLIFIYNIYKLFISKRKSVFFKSFFLFFIIFFYITSQVSADDAIDINLAIEQYNEAQNKITELQMLGYPTNPLLDILIDAENQFNNKNYNQSIETSKKVISNGEKIKTLKIELEDVTAKLNLLSYYNEDTLALNMQLLYAKSDFESANIDLSESEKNSLVQEVYLRFLNISQIKYATLQEYKNKTSNNQSFGFFEEYYENTSSYYIKKDYYQFLLNYENFDNIKKIIDILKTLDENLKEIDKEGIIFQRKNDSLNLFYEYLAQHDYKNAKKTIEELNNLSKVALKLKKEIDVLKIESERIGGLGLIDNKTSESYNSVLKEFSFENFDASQLELEKTRKMLNDLETQDLIFGGLQKAKLKQGVTSFLKENIIFIITIVLILLIIYTPLKNYISLKYSRNKYEQLKSEKETIIELQKEMQHQYYLEHSIDKKTYHDDFSKFEERKMEVINRITFYEEKEKLYTAYFDKIKKTLSTFKKKQVT